MKRVILSALAAGIFATAAAQEELTLRKCLEIGLENNYDIRICLLYTSDAADD